MRRAAAVLALVAVSYAVVTAWLVWRASLRNEPGAAEAIVVLGAAQYDGRPSPVLRARLDHAADLYAQGRAPAIWVTGGGRTGDRFTEAGASARYLHAQGVPGGAIERITTGADSTYASIAAAARFLLAAGQRRVLLVSDPFHSYRIRDVAEEVGLQAMSSPTPASPIEGTGRVRHLARETAAVAVGRLIGYRRLDRLGVLLGDAGLR